MTPRLTLWSRAAAGVVIGIGSLVLAGWALDEPSLRGPIPGLIEMKANTAVGLVLLGAALLLVPFGGTRSRRAGHGFAAAAGVIGILSLLEYVLGRGLGIDELLFEDVAGAARTTYPGRPAAPTAINFVLAGAALLVIGRRSWVRRLAEPLAAAAGLVAFFGLLGYAYGAESLSSGPATLTPIAIHTAVAFLVLCVGIVCATPGAVTVATLSGDGVGSSVARRVLTIAFVGVPLAGWLRLEGEQQGLFGTSAGVALLVLAFLVVLAAVVMSVARALNQAEVARAAFEARGDRYFELSTDLACVAGYDGYFQRINPAGLSLLGYSEEDLTKQPFMELIHPGDRDATAKEFAHLMAEGGVTVGFRNRFKAADGSYLWMEWNSRAVPEEETIYAAGRDVTRQRVSDLAMEAARAEAERANLAKSQFLSRMSHELRTPLNAILGFGQLLQMDDLDARQAGNANHIVKAGRHLLALIDEVLDLSRIEAGEMTMSLEPVHAPAAIEDVIALVKPMAAERGIAVRAEVADLSECYVQADQQRLKQVLLNLLSNAIKYNRENGEVTVSLEPADGRVRILVSDTGYGIRADRLSEAFAPFDRLGAEDTGVEGTGLGLALSKRFVDAMGGTLEVESELDVGTTFAIELPAAVAPAAKLSPPPRRPPRPGMEPRTIVYIEDNLASLKLIEQILADYPEIRLLPAMQGKLGLELARQHRPDLVLLDLHLPDLPGRTVLSHLREDPRTRDIPVVILSAAPSRGPVRQLHDDGVAYHLSKPLDVEQFVEVIEESLASRKELSLA